MKRSIFRPASVYNPPIPFPMPEPQRGASMRILIQESKRSKFPPALLVTTLQNPVDPALHAARCRVMFRILVEVDGMSHHLLSKAFRRDRHRVRDMVRVGGDQNARPLAPADNQTTTQNGTP